MVGGDQEEQGGEVVGLKIHFMLHRLVQHLGKTSLIALWNCCQIVYNYF